MTLNVFVIIVVAVVLLLSLKMSQADVNAVKALEKPVQNPSTLNQRHVKKMHLHFSYCMMNDYQEKYEKYANALLQAYPNLIVTGSYNDLSREAVQLAIFTAAAAVVAISFILKGYPIFDHILTKVSVCGLIISICTLFVVVTLSTGAFEVYLELKFSKLKD